MIILRVVIDTDATDEEDLAKQVELYLETEEFENAIGSMVRSVSVEPGD